MSIINSKGKVKRAVVLALEAHDWELYTNMDGVKGVAKLLNEGVAAAINEAPDRSSARLAAEEVLKEHRKYGAYDTEPCAVLDRILSMVFTNQQ